MKKYNNNNIAKVLFGSKGTRGQLAYLREKSKKHGDNLYKASRIGAICLLEGIDEDELLILLKLRSSLLRDIEKDLEQENEKD